MKTWPWVALLLILASAPGLRAQDPPAEDVVQFFARNCTSCHTIGGGKLVGPDLKGVLERRDEAWLTRFILDPKKVIDSGDPEARKLVEDAGGVVMPTIPGMSAAEAAKLVALIAYESGLEKSRFAGLVISDRPLTDADVERGRALFLGRADFGAGAPSCISCHTTEGLGSFGGGALGPDLTSAFARLEGRKPLAAWLSAPPSLVMQPVFRNKPLNEEEILALVAYLRSTAESGGRESSGLSLDFLLSGIGGAAVLMVLLDFSWRRRYRAVRRPLVSKD